MLARSIVPGDALPAGAARAEIYRGEESAARRAIEVVGPIVTRASSWAGLHAALARHGIAYAAKGSGAVIVVDGIAVKASTCRAASRTHLETRLGPFQPGPDSVDARPGAAHEKVAVTTSSRRPAPGIDPDLFALARQAETAASAAQGAYDAAYPMLNFAPLLKAAVAGPAPRAAPNARILAQRDGKPSPRLAPVRRPTRDGAILTGLLGHYHAALQADLYRVVAERPRLLGHSDRDADTGQDRDRLMQLTPRPMAEVAAGWPALERAAGTGRTVHLTPISAGHHYVVLSGLRKAQVDDLRVSGFTPALVLHKSGGFHEVVLTTSNLGRPYEQAALAAVGEDLRLGLGVARSPLACASTTPIIPTRLLPVRTVARAGSTRRSRARPGRCARSSADGSRTGSASSPGASASDRARASAAAWGRMQPSRIARSRMGMRRCTGRTARISSRGGRGAGPIPRGSTR